MARIRRLLAFKAVATCFGQKEPGMASRLVPHIPQEVLSNIATVLIKASTSDQFFREISRAWPRYCRKVYWTTMVQNGPKDHFGQNDLIPNWILAFARQNGPKWSILVHLGPPTVLWQFTVQFCWLDSIPPWALEGTGINP